MRRSLTLRGLVVVAVLLGTLTAASAASADSFIVLYKGNAVPASAPADVRAAGGTFVQAYDQIGVAIARSDSSAFASSLAKDKRVDGVSSTTGFASKVAEPDAQATADAAQGPKPGDLPNAPASDSDSLSPLQWDMRQMHVPDAHQITGGSRNVLVGDLDTGMDYRHPDLRQNVDDANSANCVGGAPAPGAAAADDDNGHGTHTAGTIAAAANGNGVVGVAPNVRIAAVKTATADGLFYPEAVVCAFMWAGSHHFDVTSNSYFADPYEYNCRNDAQQHAIWKAEQRAIRYAQTQGVVVVAAAGNDADDLSHPTQDRTSPDDTTPVTRDVTNACVVIPVEIPGVVGVSATGSTHQDGSAGQYPDNLKSFYSSYGVSAVDVTAPGGDSRYFTPESVNGRVLSTWPSNPALPCTNSRQEATTDPTYPTAVYCYLQGTSMATPHVAGEAALIVSRYGKLDAAGGAKMSQGRVAALLSQTADQQVCPNTFPYGAYLGTNSGLPQQCQGGAGHTSWYGDGQADALNAVTHGG